MARKRHESFMRILVCFDISDDRVRYRVVRVLKEYAHRVQKSVFEAPHLPRAAYLRMRSRVERHIDASTDSVRYYQLCRTCAGRIEHVGIAPGVLDEPSDCRVV